VFPAAKFAQNGVAVFPDAVGPESLNNIRTRISEMVDEFDPSGLSTVFSTGDQSHSRDDYFLTSGDKTRFFYEDGVLADDGTLLVDKHVSLNKIGHAMHDLDPKFSSFCRSASFSDAAAAVGMANPLLLQSMVIFKNPEIGGEVTPHTDHTFLWTEPQSVIGFWLAIDEATKENGCLWALPGGHAIPAKSRLERTSGGTSTTMEVFDETPYPDDGWVPLEAKPGTIIALHGTLPHRSAPNVSTKSRLAFTLHCIEADAEYPENNWLQRPGMPFRGF
jgi:phytanoyl-CoA hydroxylase